MRAHRYYYYYYRLITVELTWTERNAVRKAGLDRKMEIPSAIWIRASLRRLLAHLQPTINVRRIHYALEVSYIGIYKNPNPGFNRNRPEALEIFFVLPYPLNHEQ